MPLGVDALARELNRGDARGAADDHRADEQPVVSRIQLRAEMFAIAEIEPLAAPGIDRRGDHHALGVDHGGLHIFIVDAAVGAQNCRPVRLVIVVSLDPAHEEERIVDRLEGLVEVLFEDQREIVGVAGALGALRARLHEEQGGHGDPDDSDQRQAEPENGLPPWAQGAAQRRLPALCAVQVHQLPHKGPTSANHNPGWHHVGRRVTNRK